MLRLLTLAGCLVCTAGLPAQTLLYTDGFAFSAATGGTPVPIPPSSAMPSLAGPDLGCIDAATGIALPLSNPQVVVTAPSSFSLCIAGPDSTQGSVPSPFTPTIMGNGEDDYLLTFDPPVLSVGLELLTNNLADHTLTVNLLSGPSVTFTDADLETSPNTFEFVGVTSPTPIVSIFLDTVDGAVQNDGISVILLPRQFQRGDCNQDSSFNIADAISILSFLFSGGTTPDCLDPCDSNDDGDLDISDAVAVLSYQFIPGSPNLPAPFPGCGIDPTFDPLPCRVSPNCP